MRLLICTQAVDVDDPVLGFFVKWIAELSKHASRVQVVSLGKGAYELPAHVSVYSLGKESAASAKRTPLRKLRYAYRFLSRVWRLRHEYDAVFVHQNQEYVLLAGLVWKVLGKRVYFWRNHYAGSIFTDLAIALSTKVFCTSKYSYTTKYKKNVRMPVGVDLDIFSTDPAASRKPRSILSIGRIAPSKHVEVLIDALGRLHSDGVHFTAAIYGDAQPQDRPYAAYLARLITEKDLGKVVSLHPAVPNSQVPSIYRSSEIFINMSKSGMFDKTIFEAAACGCTVLASSRDFLDLAGEQFSFREADALDCAGKISMHLGKPTASRLREIAQRNSLTTLAKKLAEAMVL